MSSIAIGAKQLVYSETFLLRENELAIIDPGLGEKLPDWKIHLCFRRRGTPSREPGVIYWKPDAEKKIFLIDCEGWENALIAALTVPKKVGSTVSGSPIGVFFSGTKATEGTFIVTFQLYVGGEYTE